MKINRRISVIALVLIAAMMLGVFSVSVTAATLKTPQITRFTDKTNGVLVEWAKVTGAKYYRVFVMNAQNKWQKLGDTTATSFLDKKATWGKVRYYTVRCMNAAKTAYTSNFNATGWSHVHNLATPKIIGFSSTPNGVTFKWNVVNYAEKYRTFIYTDNRWKKLGDTTANSFTHRNAVSGTKYYYTVRCINAAGNLFTSDFIYEGWPYRYTAPDPLDTPALTSVTSVDDGLRLKWKMAPGAEKVRLFFKDEDTGKWVKLTDTAGTEYLDYTVHLGEKRTYTIRYLSADGSYYMSDYNAAGWSGIYYCETPVMTGTQYNEYGQLVRWKAITGVSSFRVFLFTNNKWNKLADVIGTGYLNTMAVKGKTYRYTVRAMNDDFTSYCSSYNNTGWSYPYNDVKKLPTLKRFEFNSTTDTVEIELEEYTYTDRFGVFIKNGTSWRRIGTINGNRGTVNSEYFPNVNTPYTITFRGINASGAYCTDYNNTGFVVRKLGVPDFIMMTKQTGNTYCGEWGAVAGAVKYEFSYSSPSAGAFSVITPNQTYYVDTTAAPIEAWTASVSAYDGKYSYGEPLSCQFNVAQG